MCLRTYQTRAKIAKTDMTVYKALGAATKSASIPVYINGAYKMAQPVQFISYHQGFSYTFGKIHTTNLRRNYGSVEYGFHSFAHLSDARKAGGKVVQCTIPKGAKYYVGSNNGSSDGYASDKIRIDKLI